MFKHYFKSAWRSLVSNRLFSALNIVGLSVGITAALMIFIQVENECSYNSMFSSKDDIFLVENNHKFNGNISTYKATSPLMAPALAQNIPQVQYAARSVFYPNILLSANNKKIYKNGSYADADFFKIFNLKFIYGNPADVFNKVNNAVITEGTARAFFGNGNPIGKTLTFNTGFVFNVSGVIKDFLPNSTIRYDWIANFNAIGLDIKKETWIDNFLETYVKLKPHTDVYDLNKRIKNFIVERDEKANAFPFLFSIRKLHLYNSFDNGLPSDSGNIRYVRLFTIVACIILLIACINFTNLATARSVKRSKEISVRKVFGAKRSSLIIQFFSETLLCSFIAIVISCVLLYAVFPLFCNLMNLSVELHYFTALHIISLIAVMLLCTLFAGIYPAFYLSAFNPANTLRSQSKFNFGSLFIRKGLVIFQFAVCIILMTASIVVYRQIQFTKNRNLGFNKSNVLYVPVSDYLKNTDYLINELKASGAVKNAAFGYNTPIGLYNSGSRFYWSGKDVNANIDIANTAVSQNYFSVFGIKMSEGRDFNGKLADSNNVIINRTLADLMGSEGKVGGSFLSEDGQTAATVIGIVNDFVFDNMNAVKSKPLLYFFNKEHYGQIFISLEPSGNLQESVAAIKKIFERVYPSSLFEYKFLDEDFNDEFIQDTLLNKLAIMFGGLAVFISCLGLFGLSSFMAEQRRKEIGIRKVLGASVFGITKMLSGDYLKLVLIAAIIGVPSAALLMKHWLNGYEYRMKTDYRIFIITTGLSFLIALLTVVFQSVKAARANPVKSLKTE